MTIPLQKYFYQNLPTQFLKLRGFLLSVLKTIRYAYGSGKLLAISSKTSFDIIVLVRQPY